MWNTYFFCGLHQHELLWYAQALSQTIEDCVDFDPAATLKDIEVAVSSRFRQASKSWTRMTIVSNAFLHGVVRVKSLSVARLRCPTFHCDQRARLFTAGVGMPLTLCCPRCSACAQASHVEIVVV